MRALRDSAHFLTESGGLRRKLAAALSPTTRTLAIDWQIGDCVATYWRPHFEPHMYPYLPVHITQPKELRRLFVVHLPERCYFAVSHLPFEASLNAFSTASGLCALPQCSLSFLPGTPVCCPCPHQISQIELMGKLIKLQAPHHLAGTEQPKAGCCAAV